MTITTNHNRPQQPQRAAILQVIESIAAQFEPDSFISVALSDIVDNIYDMDMQSIIYDIHIASHREGTMKGLTENEYEDQWEAYVNEDLKDMESQLSPYTATKIK